MSKRELTASELLSRREQAIRMQAEHLPDKSLWLVRLEEVKQLAAPPREGAEELVHLMVRYVDAEVASSRMRVDEIKSAGVCGALPDLWAELARLSHLALVTLGTTASDALLRAFQDPAISGPAKRMIFITLSQIADSRLESFFRELAPRSAEAQRALEVIAGGKRKGDS